MMINGILNLYKEQNMTSHDVVSRLRRILGMKRIGHTGTLDPMATGVLPICLGSATRIMEYLDLDFKAYRCEMMLGLVTDTQDIWGQVLARYSTESLTEDRIRAAFLPFHGVIAQKPPMYSAVHVGGRRLYEYARAGEQVEVKARQVMIRKLKVEAVDLMTNRVVFTVECSKGTYIRTICQDVGAALGCGAAMTGLTRLFSGPFVLKDTVTLCQLQAAKEEGEAALHALLARRLLPVDYPLCHFGKALLDGEQAKRFVQGWHIAKADCQIVRAPEFAEAGDGEPLHVREEYRRAYLLYQAAGAKNGLRSEETFLGVAFYDLQYRKFIADKVFFQIGKNGEEEKR